MNVTYKMTKIDYLRNFLKCVFSMKEDAIVEKIGYPEMCVNKTLLEEYYQGVCIKMFLSLCLLA